MVPVWIKLWQLEHVEHVVDWPYSLGRVLITRYKEYLLVTIFNLGMPD